MDCLIMMLWCMLKFFGLIMDTTNKRLYKNNDCRDLLRCVLDKIITPLEKLSKLIAKIESFHFQILFSTFYCQN